MQQELASPSVQSRRWGPRRQLQGGLPAWQAIGWQVTTAVMRLEKHGCMHRPACTSSTLHI
jgi:hypothetical protein